MTYWKFVNWEPAQIETVLQERVPRAMAAFDAGDKKPFSSLRIATTDPTFRLGGWAFDMRPYLRRFWVMVRHYGIKQYWAANRTAIRETLGAYNVLEIVEMKD